MGQFTIKHSFLKKREIGCVCRANLHQRLLENLKYAHSTEDKLLSLDSTLLHSARSQNVSIIVVKSRVTGRSNQLHVPSASDFAPPLDRPETGEDVTLRYAFHFVAMVTTMIAKEGWSLPTCVAFCCKPQD